MFSATRLQVATYLLGVCPFSIAFLVYLNSSVSFVITDLIGREKGVGDAVGTLGFADELLALIACPLWGLLSDRIGVRYVCVMGYAIIALALVLFVQAHNVYPQLLLGRLFFSIGGAAASTMVTAVLPAVSSDEQIQPEHEPVDRNHTSSPSINSELTITPTRYRHRMPPRPKTAAKSSYGSTSRVAGFVGMFTGCGALIALLLFLPLPARFQHSGLSPGRALQYSFYIVAAIALFLSIWCFFGLRNLAAEKKSSTTSPTPHKHTHPNPTPPKHLNYLLLNLRTALTASLTNPSIALGYLGGFVARASSVGISLFIPLLVNALFRDSHLCKPATDQPSSSSPHPYEHDPNGLPDLKLACPRAYIVAASLTGAAETMALIAAPLFGYFSARCKQRRGIPMMVAAAAGVVGYPLFVAEFDPHDELKAKRGMAFLAVALVGISQIGAIVCSLGVLSAGVLEAGAADADAHQPPDVSNGSSGPPHHHSAANGVTDVEAPALTAPTESPSERDALLPTPNNTNTDPTISLSSTAQPPPLTHLKGAIAGIYSFWGGLAILLLTKLGGSLFDSVSVGAPFYILAGFNAVLFVVCGVIGVGKRPDP